MEKGDIPARNFFHYKKINEFIDFFTKIITRRNTPILFITIK
jgi:hypothetical protein